MTGTVELTFPFEPRPWQNTLFASIARFPVTVCVAARRSGKSTAAAMALLVGAMTRPGRYALVLPEKRHAKLIYWQLFKELAGDFVERDLVRFKEAELIIEVGNGTSQPSEIVLFAGEDGGGAIRGSGLRGAVLDEFQLVKSGDDLLAGTVLPALNDDPSDPGFCAILGTPMEPSALGRAAQACVSKPGWNLLHFPITAMDHVTEADRQRLEAESLTPQHYAAEFLCDMRVGVPNALFDLAALNACMARTAPQGARHLPLYRNAARVLACDVGGPGLHADLSVIARKHGPQVLPLIVVQDVNELALSIAQQARSFEADVIALDGTGGHASGVQLQLEQLGFAPLPIVFSNASTKPTLHANRRAEMYSMLAEFTRKETSILPNDPELLAELAAQTYGADAKGRMILPTKEKLRSTLGRSPDRADAVAMLMVAELMAVPRSSAASGLSGPLRSPWQPGSRYQSDYRNALLPQMAQHDPYEHDPFS